MGTQTKSREMEFSMPGRAEMGCQWLAMLSLHWVWAHPVIFCRQPWRSTCLRNQNKTLLWEPLVNSKASVALTTTGQNPPPGRAPMGESRSGEPLPTADGQEVGKSAGNRAEPFTRSDADTSVWVGESWNGLLYQCAQSLPSGTT